MRNEKAKELLTQCLLWYVVVGVNEEVSVRVPTNSPIPTSGSADAFSKVGCLNMWALRLTRASAVVKTQRSPSGIDEVREDHRLNGK